MSLPRPVLSIRSSSKIGHTMREICFNLPWIKSTSQIGSAWVATNHQYGISPLLLQTSFLRETNLFFEVTPFKSQQFCRWLYTEPTYYISQKTNHIKSSWMDLNCCINFEWFYADTDSTLYFQDSELSPFQRYSWGLSTFNGTEKTLPSSMTINIKSWVTMQEKIIHLHGTNRIKRSDNGSQNYPTLLSNVCNLLVLSQFGIDGLQFLT